MMNTDFLRREYKSSPMREGVLCWYPFKENAAVLYNGEALLELFAYKGLIVEKELNSDAIYDYVIVIDPEFPDGFSVDTFSRYKNLLKPDGKLLFAYENPFGLRYFAGKLPSISPVIYPYESLYGRAVGVGREECILRLKQAGFTAVKSYYPFTDHWFAQEVYSENYLPDQFLGHKTIPYIDSDTPLAFDERYLYNEVIRGGAFEFLCPSFLFEASVDSVACPVEFAVVTTYRQPKNRFATVVYSDDIVLKMPLHLDAVKSARHIVETHNELEKLGVSILPLEIGSDGSITMKRVDAPTLINYWSEKWKTGTLKEDEIIMHYDIIKGEIEKASVECICYPELVPANCFIKDNKLIFFDQEFSYRLESPKYAADVALTRAILALTMYNHSCYGYGINDERFIASVFEKLKSRYGLYHLWDELVAIAHERITRTETVSESLALLSRASMKTLSRNESAKEFSKGQAREAAYILSVSKLKTKGAKHPIIYGYGVRGRALCHACQVEEVTVAAIVDRDVCKSKSIPNTEFFTSLDEAVELNKESADCVVISPLKCEDILSEYSGKFSLPIYTLAQLQEEVNNEL